VTTSDVSDVWVTPSFISPGTTTETIFADVLAGIVGVDAVSVDSHFFDDLGADSMLMARFCARLRKRDNVPSVSMKDIYQHSTVRLLAAALAEPAPVESDSEPEPEPEAEPSVESVAPAPSGRYVLCGALQLLIFLGYTYVAVVIGAWGYEWVSAGSGWSARYLRLVVYGGVTFAGLAAFPILVKWTLVGRWRREQIPLWSLAYVRFWVVKTLVRANPLVLFVGTPLYVLYLRALGAHVGRGVTILARGVPVCTDLLTIGDGTVIRKDSVFNCYRAHAGAIQTGAVTIGTDAVVSEATVLDIDTSLGDGAQLGHASALHAGQSVPAGERWHGSPAQASGVDYRAVEEIGCSRVRKTAYTVGQLLYLLLVGLPLAIVGFLPLLAALPQIKALLDTTPMTTAFFYEEVLTASFVLFFGGLGLGLVVVTTVPRLLARTFEPGKVYPLYGFHYSAHRAITRLTNGKLFMLIAGDSSYVVHYLRAIGYHLRPVEQTGSNFGTAVKHETPFLATVGRGTMVADGLSIMNADFSSTSFRLSPVAIGPRNFLGNTIAYPSQGRTGDNCLLATKVMVPIDGAVRENVGLLGSPCFEIPRSVWRDSSFDHLAVGEAFHRRLAAKNRYNIRTAALFLFVRWMHFFLVTLLAVAGGRGYDRFGALALAAASVLIVVASLGYFLLVERAATKFRPLSPRFCSIYEPYFWFHERYWKLLVDGRFTGLFNGTPFKGLWWRLSGVDIGRRVFDDGCEMLERTLTTIGDDCTLNIGSEIQCHSQEDGAFKTDRSALGDRCTLGVGALVHYGVTMGDGAVLEADSFLMKGEEVPTGARWGGNPARQIVRGGATQ
jgi:non-ribosomal peptide synthetase-like protein